MCLSDSGAGWGGGFGLEGHENDEYKGKGGWQRFPFGQGEKRGAYCCRCRPV
jgi:hypothetical protein